MTGPVRKGQVGEGHVWFSDTIQNRMHLRLEFDSGVGPTCLILFWSFYFYLVISLAIPGYIWLYLAISIKYQISGSK